jgi:Trk K+ transport system NAD-binding subunit
VDARLNEGVPSLAEESDSRTGFLEVTIPDDSQVHGKTIAEVSIPRSAVLVSIKRGDEVIIPRGDTLLHTGDIVTILCERDSTRSVKTILLSGTDDHNDYDGPTPAHD